MMLTRRDVIQISARAVAVAAGLSTPDTSAAELAQDTNASGVDLCIYGGTSAGVVAAIQMHRLGRKALIIEPGKHLGGLTSGGLGATDIGNKNAIGGISREFYARVLKYYTEKYGAGSKQVADCKDGFQFEPGVAEQIFRTWLAEYGIPVRFGERLRSVQKMGNRIVRIETEPSSNANRSGGSYSAAIFLDATYEGDLMQRAGVSYTVGREPNAQYGETLNGIYFGHPQHNFKRQIDPYKKPGDKASGLLVGISNVAANTMRQGEGDKRVQAYNFRMCLTKAPNRLPFPKPAGYDPERYELFARYLNAGIWDALRLHHFMPNGKTDTNNYGGFSSDNIGMNYEYPDGDYAKRQAIFDDHVTYQQGMMWFLCNDPRVPAEVQADARTWGLPVDEFTETGGWPHQLYIREARRMVSPLVITEKHCTYKAICEDSIGLAAYTMDSHNCTRVARNEYGVMVVRNEGNVEVPPAAPYAIGYGAIVPKESECANLLVPVCLSSSHIAFGSIRMEPVFMLLAQSAATAAYYAIVGKTSVQNVSVPTLQRRLRDDQQILAWTKARKPDQ